MSSIPGIINRYQVGSFRVTRFAVFFWSTSEFLPAIYFEYPKYSIVCIDVQSLCSVQCALTAVHIVQCASPPSPFLLLYRTKYSIHTAIQSVQ